MFGQHVRSPLEAPSHQVALCQASLPTLAPSNPKFNEKRGITGGAGSQHTDAVLLISTHI